MISSALQYSPPCRVVREPPVSSFNHLQLRPHESLPASFTFFSRHIIFVQSLISITMEVAANWSFEPLISSFPPTIFPNVQLWNISNGLGLEYQVEVSWPFGWESQETEASALAMYADLHLQRSFHLCP